MNLLLHTEKQTAYTPFTHFYDPSKYLGGQCCLGPSSHLDYKLRAEAMRLFVVWQQFKQLLCSAWCHA